MLTLRMAKKSKAAKGTPDDPIDAEVVSSGTAQSGADRVRASRLRARVRVGAPLSPEDAVWLGNYDSAQDQRSARGASHVRTTKFEESESSAVGTGDAASVAAAAAYAREEGRRYDHMLSGAITGLTAACNMYKDMAETLLARAVEDGHVMRDLMSSVREHYLQRTELEAQQIRDQAERDAEALAEQKDRHGLDSLVEQCMPIILAKLGVPMPPNTGGKR